MARVALDQDIAAQLGATRWEDEGAAPFGLGIDVTDNGAAIDKSCVAAGDIYAVRPITRGKFWGIIAVPDLRVACGKLVFDIQKPGTMGWNLGRCRLWFCCKYSY